METSNSTAIYTYPERLVGAILWTLVCIFGTIGNCMVILAVVFSRKLQTTTNAFVISLSVADLLTSLSVIGTVFALVGKEGWPLPYAEWFCSLCAFLLYACGGVSLYSLAAIAVNRMVLITRPGATYAKLYKKKNIVIMIAVTWIVPILVSTLPPLLNLGGLGYDKDDTTCSDLDQHPKGKIFETILTVFYFPGPVIILITCYTKSFLHIRKHFKRQRNNIDPVHLSPANQAGTGDQETRTTDNSKSQVTGGPETQMTNDRETRITDDTETRMADDTETHMTGNPGSQVTCNLETQMALRCKKLEHQEIQITKSLFLVVCLFFLCILPYVLVLFIPGARRVALFAFLPPLANSAINPWVYGSKHPHFKGILVKMIKCRYHEIPEPPDFMKRIIQKS